MPSLSIIIPTLGDWEALETTLVAVLQNRPDESEVVVAVNRPYADPYALRDEVQFLESPRRSRLVDLINAGFAAARGDIIHVLACGAEVGEGWVEPALRHFIEPQIALVAPLLVDTSGTRVVTAGCTWSRGGTCSSLGSGAPLDAPLATGGDWIGPEVFSGFYRRTALAEAGTFDATLPADLAAIDLSLRMRQAGRCSLLEPKSQVNISGSLLVRTRALRQAWHSERLFWRHLGGGNVVRKLASHAATLLFEVACAVPRPANAVRLAGRVAGICDPRQARRTQVAGANAQTSTTSHTERRVDGPHPIASPLRGGGSGRASVVSLSANEATS